jgi:DNA-binding transcriptional MerR regulator
MQEPVVIPDKLYFKIGEVCDLVGVQAHVLRYWETEFSMLSPQKNKSGQRSYRRRDVETALRIKQLLYNEMFTIAGARKKLQSEQREGAKPKSSVSPSATASARSEAPGLFDNGFDRNNGKKSNVSDGESDVSYNDDQRDAIKKVTQNLLEIRDILNSPPF